METNKSSVPKFASFTAKRPVTNTAQLQGAATAVVKTTNTNHIHRRSRDELVHREAHKDRKRKSHHHSEVVVKKTKPDIGYRAQIDSGLPTFVVDTKGNPDNLKFGGASKWQVPKYISRKAGILGGGKYMRYDDVTNSDGRVRSALSRRRAQLPIPRRIKRSLSEASDDEANHDFIRVSTKKHPDHRNFGRSIEEVRDLSTERGKLQDDDDTNESDADLSEHEDQRSILEKNAEYNRAVRSDPNGITNWLHLIKHQEQIIMLENDSTNSGLGPTQRRKLADIRLVMYQDALKKSATSLQLREQLWLGMVTEAEHVFDFEAQVLTWQQAVEDCPQSVKIRLQQLDFVQGHYLKYGSTLCKEKFVETLIFVKSLVSGNKDAKFHRELCNLQSYIFLRLTVFLEQSGHHELAFALWQSALDFVCFAPQGLQDALQSYGDFWDAEAPRLGNGSDSGWAAYLQGKTSVAFVDSVLVAAGPEPLPSSTMQHRFKTLVATETLAMARFDLPGMIEDTLDDDADADAYHIVMSSDICPIIGTLIDSSDYQQYLATAFLCFAQLPNLPSVPEDCLYWWRDPWISNAPSRVRKADFSASPDETKCSGMIQFHRETIASLLANEVNASKFSISKAQTINNVLRLLRDKFSFLSDVNPLVLAMLRSQKGDNAAAKEAKKLLKHNSHDILLYQCLYLLEQQRDNNEVADKIISTPLRMRTTFPLNIQPSLIILWRTWIWHNFLNNNVQRTLQLLLSLDTDHMYEEPIESLKSQSATLLKSKQWIEEGIQKSLHYNELENFVLLVDVGMLLAYIASGSSLCAVTAYIDGKLELINSPHQNRNKITELLHQSRTTLIVHHAKHVRPYRPAEVQELLKESIELYPDNSIFLVAYADHESSFGVNDRLRGISPLLEHEQHNSLARWLTLIWIEHHRCLALQGPQHSTRALLERAVESDSKFSSTLWLLYLHFEKHYGNTNQYKAVLTRALTRLPWVKAIVLDGLDHLDGKLPNEELEQLYYLLEERDIRMMHNRA